MVMISRHTNSPLIMEYTCLMEWCLSTIPLLIPFDKIKHVFIATKHDDRSGALGAATSTSTGATTVVPDRLLVVSTHSTHNLRCSGRILEWSFNLNTGGTGSSGDDSKSGEWLTPKSNWDIPFGRHQSAFIYLNHLKQIWMIGIYIHLYKPFISWLPLSDFFCFTQALRHVFSHS
jgi:hypothetical protein